METMIFNVDYYRVNNPQLVKNKKVFVDACKESTAIITIINSFANNNHIVKSCTFVASETHENILKV